MSILLGTGDAVTGNELDLNDLVNYFVLAFDAPTPRDGAEERTLTLTLLIKATATNSLIDAIRAIEQVVPNMATAGRSPTGEAGGVALKVRWVGADEYVYFDVKDGYLDYPAAGIENVGSSWVQLPFVLTCLPYARGDAITDDPVTVTGDSPVFTRASIPGDVPAYIQYSFTDNSDPVVVNGIRIGHRSQADLDAGDFEGYLNAAAISPATDDVDASAFGDDVATLDGADVVPTSWQDVAYVVTPAPLADNAGMFDIWARTANANEAINAPVQHAITANTSGALPVGTYQVCVTALNAGGVESPASNIQLRNVHPVTLNDRFIITYIAPTSGTPIDYRVYWKRSTEPWKYKAVGSAAQTYNLDNESGSTTAAPPTEMTGGGIPQFRAQISLESGTTRLTLPPVAAQLSNGVAEWLYLGNSYVPPMTMQEGGSTRAGRVTVQVKSPIAADISVDCVVMLPTPQQQVAAEYVGKNLAETRVWVFGSNRHGRNHGLLISKADGTERGQLSVLGPSLAGPGDTTFCPIFEVAGGVSNIADVTGELVLTITPRFRLVRGSS